jgi:PAS domain S-box-containing protein
MRDSQAAGQRAIETDLFGPFRYPLAGLLALAAGGVQLALNPISNPAIPILVSLLAVGVCAYFCGRRLALCVTAANLLTCWYFCAPPRFSFSVADRAMAWQLALFAIAGAVVSLASNLISGRRHFPVVALMLASSLILVIAAVLVWLDFEHSRDAEGWVEHTYQVLNVSEELLTAIQEAEGGQRNYLLTGDNQYVTFYRSAVDSALASRKRLGELTVDNPAQQTRLRELDGLIGTRLALLEHAIGRRQQRFEAAADVVPGGEGARTMDRIRMTVADVKMDEHSLLNQRTKQVNAQAATTRWALAMGPTLLVAVLIIAGLLIQSYVTRLQTSEQTLRRQADLLDKSPGPIIVWQLGGAIEYWNHGAEELYGFSREQAVGRGHNDLLHPMHPLGMAAIQELLARDGEWNGELSHMIDGREVIVESHMTLVTERDGRKTVLKANRDITREKRAYQEIQELNRELEKRVQDRTAQLEASNKELESFAYSVSHDLRAPLRGINGWSQALLEDYRHQLDEKAQQYLARVLQESQHMGHLIDDLLDLSRLTRVELLHESVDLTSLAHKIASRLQESEPARKLDFVIQEGLTTGGDVRLLEIALSNLLNNAVKFTGLRPLARIEFGQTMFQDQPALYIRDNGVGFDMAYSQLLFGAFQRLHKHSEFPGSGIGLATVQRVLHRHGGSIWADSKLDEGATFYFTIGAEPSPKMVGSC